MYRCFTCWPIRPAVDPGFARVGEADHGECAEREPKRGSVGAEPPAGSRGGS